jgi:Inner membrane component of T3SS, cytoplasmic domain
VADKMTRCPEGHFYDPTKHNACPWCALPADVEGGEKTRPVQAGPPPLPPPPPPPPPLPKLGATRRADVETSGGKNDPVVGWLVCLVGPDRGRDFRLHAEKNFIGRSPAMDVCLAGDETVSRERHAMVIFDPKKQVFWAIPGDASGLVYLNGDIVHSPTQMQRDDVLEVGRTKLALIPFCGEKYTWSREFSVTGEMDLPGV